MVDTARCMYFCWDLEYNPRLAIPNHGHTHLEKEIPLETTEFQQRNLYSVKTVRSVEYSRTEILSFLINKINSMNQEEKVLQERATDNFSVWVERKRRRGRGRQSSRCVVTPGLEVLNPIANSVRAGGVETQGIERRGLATCHHLLLGWEKHWGNRATRWGVGG
ncbi:hypothetical protein RRG08_021427 [Elysia crispata]|uniref:Uncharacterized protein n=1 Tax=Elysia crispata TaxID=231223 RepID=A0AAE1A7A2_9GAST|nr:hypothetical protein RRG08_021427 [Elysia crispata]